MQLNQLLFKCFASLIKAAKEDVIGGKRIEVCVVN